MQVDEARGDDKPRRIQRWCPHQRRLGQHHDLAGLDADMTDCIEPGLRVDYATASNEEIEGRRVLRGRGRHGGKQEQDGKGKQQRHEGPRFETVTKTTYLISCGSLGTLKVTRNRTRFSWRSERGKSTTNRPERSGDGSAMPRTPPNVTCGLCPLRPKNDQAWLPLFPVRDVF